MAEDVEKVNPDLVVRDKEGKAYSVRYEQVNAMLLNEFLKEHKSARIENATDTTGTPNRMPVGWVAGNRANAQFEMSGTAPQVAANGAVTIAVAPHRPASGRCCSGGCPTSVATFRERRYRKARRQSILRVHPFVNSVLL